jgi:cyclase
MFRPRVIPVLLLKGNALVKTRRFGDPKYIGDPINAVRIFNDLKADELVFLDIMASKEKRSVSPDFVRKISEESNMPFAVGGGIRTLEHIRGVMGAGAEKVVLNTHAASNPGLVEDAARAFGSSTIVVGIDVKRDLLGRPRTWILGGTRSTGQAPEDYARLVEEKGAGELIVQSIPRDGMMEGYDIDLIRRIADSVSIPVIALGGAGTAEHLRQAHVEGHATGLAAGSLFVFQGPRRGVLINYPERSELGL